MSNNPFNNKKFQALRRQWYDKLKKTGFKDLEHTSNNGAVSPYLTRNSTGTLRNQYDVSTVLYFQIVANFATHYPFDSKLDRLIMQFHADGMPYREMSRKIKDLTDSTVKASPATICNRLKTLKTIMFEWDVNHPEGLSYTRNLFEDYEEDEDISKYIRKK